MRSIGSYENWLEQSIREAQQRGEFDNLKGQGKPQDLAGDPNAGDMESGFRILRNNGLAPAWIEADKEIRAEQAALAELAERTARFIDAHRHDAELARPLFLHPPRHGQRAYAASGREAARNRARRTTSRWQTSATNASVSGASTCGGLKS